MSWKLLPFLSDRPILERDEHDVDLTFVVPVLVELSLAFIEFQVRNFECDRNIGFGCDEQELEVPVGRLDLLLVG